ncbi:MULTISPECIES: hypothetical protein [Enterobacteriaceae]|uniref:hypothetical protein n=1 Tax=Enterobacteriaceae TaxID=543 RepID=UPI000A5A4911|nr:MULTISPECIES: hypothetical protein [Enterobacteriaceae]MDQ2233061.1 hypothetical protein [Citrobacter portucalensis]MDV1012782.1 hypothetical protein [Klebsiella grimontii]MDV1023484.1 hypothetical protein [Klebsiella grimontii]MDV1040056.1 hypothetical protein [Klebsiella grimontii]MDV1106692.1 hypothetical protein [Klebsiella grimontii]
MENTANWRTESRTVYSNDFKLRIVELASQPDAFSNDCGSPFSLRLGWAGIHQRSIQTQCEALACTPQAKTIRILSPEGAISHDDLNQPGSEIRNDSTF